MTETENRRNREYSYNKYYIMPSREELHRGYGGNICESDFNIVRGKNTLRSSAADKIISDWKFDERCHKNIINKEESKKNNG